ncbi:MAG: protein kinase [Prevotella sp.]|nr:protein kinase [Prevotella sp.]
MESSQFTDNQSRYEAIEQMETQGATCDTFRVKLYGKLHFLKRLKAEYAGDIRYQEALRKEFETGYRLEHPNLVRYLSLDDNSILMEYVDGEPLSQRLTSHPDYFKNRKNTDKFVRQLLDVLDYLHSHQVLHLDLKPDNILLTRINDDVKLIDFGFCYTDTFPDTTGRTESYAAPEQLSTVNSQLSIQTDIYALGKILELLPSHHIYNKVIARCTAENPSDRYQSITEVARTIANSARSRHFLYVLIALLIAVAVIVSVLLSQGKEPQQEQPVAPVDTQSVKSVDTTSVTPVSAMPKEEDKQPKNISPTTSAPVTPATSPTKETSIEQLRADISKAVLPKFNATLGALSDSVQPGTTAWTEAGWALEKSLENTLTDLILSHSDIPMEQVAKEYTSYLQSLITLKYNKAMKR